MHKGTVYIPHKLYNEFDSINKIFHGHYHRFMTEELDFDEPNNLWPTWDEWEKVYKLTGKITRIKYQDFAHLVFHLNKAELIDSSYLTHEKIMNSSK